MRINAFIVIMSLCAGCSGSEEPASVPEPTVNEGSAVAAEPAPPPISALPNGAELLGGEFEFTGSHNGHELRHALRYDGSTFTRIVNGRTTAAGEAHRGLDRGCSVTRPDVRLPGLRQSL
jgi:hypothetical protein